MNNPKLKLRKQFCSQQHYRARLRNKLNKRSTGLRTENYKTLLKKLKKT